MKVDGLMFHGAAAAQTVATYPVGTAAKNRSLHAKWVVGGLSREIAELGFLLSIAVKIELITLRNLYINGVLCGSVKRLD